MRSRIQASGFPRTKSARSLMNSIRSKAESTAAQAWVSLLRNAWWRNKEERFGWNPNWKRVRPSFLPSPVPWRRKMEELPKHNQTTKKVLVVDDEEDTLEIIEALLRFEGYDIIPAVPGEEGVRKAEEENPEVILMDINLPGIDGNEALRRIRTQNPHQCVIMLTAFATVENAIQALKEGATDFVKKPFEN